MEAVVQLRPQRLHHGRRGVSQDESVVPHPVVDVLVALHVPQPVPGGPFHEKRVRREEAEVVRHPARHRHRGPFKELLRSGMTKGVLFLEVGQTDASGEAQSRRTPLYLPGGPGKP